MFQNKCFSDWRLSIKLIRQDLPSSLLKPASKSCRLHNGRHTASKQVPAVLITLPLHKVLLPDNLCDFVTSTVDSLSFISLMHTCLLWKAFPCPFTTFALQHQQRRVVWQSRLYSAVDVPIASTTIFIIFKRACKVFTTLLHGTNNEHEV